MVATKAADTTVVTMGQRLKFLAALAGVGVTFVLLEKVIPKAGFIMAAAVGFWWLMSNGGVEYISAQLNKLSRGVGNVL